MTGHPEVVPDLHPTFESRAIVCTWSTRSSLWARDSVAHAIKRCSMKRTSTIYGISKFVGLREDKDARTVIKEHGGEG